MSIFSFFFIFGVFNTTVQSEMPERAYLKYPHKSMRILWQTLVCSLLDYSSFYLLFDYLRRYISFFFILKKSLLSIDNIYSIREFWGEGAIGVANNSIVQYHDNTSRKHLVTTCISVSLTSDLHRCLKQPLRLSMTSSIFWMKIRKDNRM